MKLSPHFTTEEFASHDGTPLPHHAYKDTEDLCTRFLEPLRRRYGPVRVISGFRTEAHNRAVGGAPASFHVCRAGRWGAAADVACRDGSPSRWADFLETLNPGGLGRYPSHVHVDNRRGRARW